MSNFRPTEKLISSFEYIFNMPWGDGTGPWGWGPRTGRGAGFCSGYPVPGFMNRWVFPPFGGRWLALWGFGWRFARRFGRRYRYGWRWW